MKTIPSTVRVSIVLAFSVGLLYSATVMMGYSLASAQLQPATPGSGPAPASEGTQAPSCRCSKSTEFLSPIAR